jgi:hypothetical protein
MPYSISWPVDDTRARGNVKESGWKVILSILSYKCNGSADNLSKGDAALDSLTGNKEDIKNVVNSANGCSENLSCLFW